MTNETTSDAILEERPMTTRFGTEVTLSVCDAGLPSLDSFDPEYQDDPHRFNAAALAQAPVVMRRLGRVVLAYDLVEKVLRDPRFRPPRGLGLEAQGITTGPLWDRAVSSILSLDGDEHHRLRRLVSRSFTPRVADRLRATMVEVITGLVDPLTRRGHCDVVADIARPYPIPIICDLLGAPAGDWQRFSAWTDDVFKIFNFNVASDAPDILRALDELDDYIDAMVDDRRHTPTGDLVWQPIRAEDDGDSLSRDDLNSPVLAVPHPGTDTTRNQLAPPVQVFSDHPGH